ncbi:hypothetical protein Ngar_c12970 [Candidatus Nitrososphaera gargensis Ga9.2]|uniref:Uncharacterized protein n=1 Tax=Nitrososphaera gargensis (strain Ga9.2) TaxID=1237085 RepID=K0IEQ2_NITGG|nr:hypothetical protein [Candidatus Nitrososphaera gargensis]AFU58235.1 hypothetical protein Ngar_c12970 [Candidatus Nitrososphaera gargensis Ga9.2]
MEKCPVHTEFFDDSCEACKREYLEMKDAGEPVTSEKKYKEFTEERAKKLYEELMLQYLKSGATETDADRKAKAIIRKQCSIRGMPHWPWI